MKILIADDELLIRKTLKKVFEQMGHEVKIFENGSAAIESWPDFQPDLAILDVIMPIEGATDILKYLNENSQLLSTKIIIISAYSAGGTKEEFLKMGAVDFIRKPFDNVFDFAKLCTGYCEIQQ